MDLILLPFHKHQFIPSDRTLELYFSGCPHRCSGCQNAHLFEVTKSNTVWTEISELVSSLDDYTSITKTVHILGGEPFSIGEEGLYILTSVLYEKGFRKIVIFTGYTHEELGISTNLHDYELFKRVYAVKFGKYEKALDPIDNHILDIKLASSNQYVLRGGSID